MSAAVSESRGERESRLATAVFRLDSWLRRRQGVFEYTADPKCVFRLQRTVAGRRVELSDGTVITPGNPILALHIWNEHVPPMPASGPDFAWARKIGRGIERSLRLLERYLGENAAAYRGVTAICADMSFEPAARNDRVARLSSRFGFEWRPEATSRPGRLRRLGENILMLLLVAASNPAAARPGVLRREHTVAYLSRRLLAQRYGTAPQEADVRR